jgi:hypothetical protein
MPFVTCFLHVVNPSLNPACEQAWIESLKPSAKAIALTLKFPINFLLLALFVIAATCAIVLSVVRQRQDAGICPTPRGG